MGPFVRGQEMPTGCSTTAARRAWSLDCATRKGKEIIRELVKVSDILIQNFRPGAIATMEFGYDNSESIESAETPDGWVLMAASTGDSVCVQPIEAPEWVEEPALHERQR